MMFASLIQAARPKTLPAAVVPVCLGCVLVYHLTGVVDYWLAVSTLMGAIFIQIATNFFNDAIDADKGADTERRLGPQRVTASGKMSRKAVYLSAFLCLGIASIFGMFMMIERGWVMLAIGIPSFYLSYGYTGGPLPLAYRGLGEVFVLLFFGWIAVAGTVFVQTGSWYLEALVLGTQVGLLSAVLISINNIRDREEDATTGKKTLAVKFGKKTAIYVVWGMTLVAYLLGFLWVGEGKSRMLIYPLFIYPLGAFICRKIMSESEEKYNKYLALSALQLILFGTTWCVAALI